MPDAVRRALRLSKRDRIVYRLLEDGTVVLQRKATPEDGEADPVVGRFLAFLAQDLHAHPERVQAVDTRLLERIRPLIDGVELDLEAPLPPEDE